MITVLHKIGYNRFLESPDHLVNKDDFVVVATVDAEGLENLYNLLQNDAVDWPEKPGVTAMPDIFPRSLSVGDLLQLESGRLFEVRRFGFEEVHWCEGEAR